VADLLRSLGVPARDEEVVTSGAAAARMLAAQLPHGAPVLAVGSPALREELRSVGLRPVDGAAEKPVAVVQGYGSTVGWADLAEGCIALRAGAHWVATNTDATMPSHRGPVPGNGSMVAALTTALGGRRPDVVVGKPEPTLFEVAAKHGGHRRALVVGDRLDTDIEGATRAGMDSLLVLTGVSTAADVLRATPIERPTHLAADLRGLSKPDDATRVPAWPGTDSADKDGSSGKDGSARPDTGVMVGAWLVGYAAGRLSLSLSSTGSADSSSAYDAIDSLRALASAAWAHPDWTSLAADGPAAAQALHELGLTAT
jgi:HAD superfamily hydrolase (TIGR01450 family)